MRFKSFLLAFLLLPMMFSVSLSQSAYVPLVFRTGSDPDVGDTLWIQVQVATDSLFGTLIKDETIKCKPDTSFTYILSVSNEGRYWWKARHRDSQNAYSVWTNSRYFVFKWNSTPTGCSCLSPANGAIIIRNR
jgi:hypothetical protein